MNKLLIITGPTAVGKTAMGAIIAEKFSGEIISADSRQVYKYLDIGTGKDTTVFQWGLDLVLPDKTFNVSDFTDYATKVIEDIWQRHKLPIIVGGSGQYIKELIDPSETLHIPPDRKLRQQLSRLSVGELQKELQRTDPAKWQQMNESDRNNPRRLVRAIEVQGRKNTQSPINASVLIIGLQTSQDILFKRIDERVKRRIQMGFAGELARLEKMGYTTNTIGYRGESVAKWESEEHAYARRQMTYLTKFLQIESKKGIPTSWFDITDTNFRQEVIQTVQAWYSKTNDQSWS